jgi:hypothetical protein
MVGDKIRDTTNTGQSTKSLQRLHPIDHPTLVPRGIRSHV